MIVPKTLSFIFSSLVFTIVWLYSQVQAMPEDSSLIDKIVGPFGALVLALVCLYIAWRFINKLANEVKDSHKREIEAYKEMLKKKKE